MAHSRTAVDHPAGTFNAAQLEMLRADPQLVVEELAPAPAPAAPTNSALPANGVDAPASSQGEALTEAAVTADQTDANAGDQMVAGTHAEGEGAPGSAAAVPATDPNQGAQPQADAAGGDAPPADPAEGAAGAPAASSRARPRGKA